MARNKVYILLLSFILASSLANGLIIQGIESNKDAYANGDLIELTIYANEKDLKVNADFSKLDSGYKPQMVMTEESEDFVYKIWYTITFTNNKGSGLHSVVVSAYSKKSDSSTLATYGIEIDNNLKLNQTIDSDLVKIKVRARSDSEPTGNGSVITVKNGQIMVCKTSGCVTLSEEDYEDTRRIIISKGQVELSNLTYNQLKSQIEADVSKRTQAEIQKYLVYVASIHGKMNDTMFDMKDTIKKAQESAANSTMHAESIIQRGFWLNVGTIFAVLLIVVGALYLVYLKTNSTWMDH